MNVCLNQIFLNKSVYLSNLVILKMRWLPKWVGYAYAALWERFQDRLFYVEDAAEKLLEKPVLHLLSELRRNQALFVFDRVGRKRRYRLVPPNLLVEAIAGRVDLSWLSQGPYANLVLHVYSALAHRYADHFVALALFGSLARNAARPESDIDLLAVTDKFPNGLGARVRQLCAIQEDPVIAREMAFLLEYDVVPRLSFHPFTPGMLRISPFMIDISFDVKVLHDQGPLRAFLRRVQAVALTLDAERKPVGGGHYYLDLHVPFGEVKDFD
jgi:hypothetical protein